MAYPRPSISPADGAAVTQWTNGAWELGEQDGWPKRGYMAEAEKMGLRGFSYSLGGKAIQPYYVSEPL